MPVFISYSHQDCEFATRLAAQLVKHKAQVWIDQWELHVGDSIIDRIERAIEGASALLVVLSKASVGSEWCKKEISSGLLRELEARRVIVLPVLLDDCKIPLFLRGKLYADFRTDFDKGLRAVLEAIARVTSESLGRLEEPEWHVDWAIDWGIVHDSFVMRVTLIEQAEDQPYSALTEIQIIANHPATTRYLAFAKHDLDWVERAAIVNMLVESSHDKDIRVVLEDSHPKSKEIQLRDPKLGTSYRVVITARRLGEDTGRDILLDLGGQLRRIRDTQRRALRRLTPDEAATVRRIQTKLDPRPSDHPPARKTQQKKKSRQPKG